MAPKKKSSENGTATVATPEPPPGVEIAGSSLGDPEAVSRVAELHRDTRAKLLREELAAPFNPQDVKFKPQMVKNNRCLAMAYIDARLVMDRLDEVLGAGGWQDEYAVCPDGSVVCRLSVAFGQNWVTKTDVGSPSEQSDAGDRLKAAFSDALKRAAVKFGVGRYLYRLPAQWVDYDPVKRQIARPPQLPPFAIPKTRRDTAGYSEPEEMEGPVAEDGAKTPDRHKPSKPWPMPTKEGTDYGMTVGAWANFLDTVPDCKALTDALEFVREIKDGKSKESVKYMFEHAAKVRGWRYDKSLSSFVEDQVTY